VFCVVVSITDGDRVAVLDTLHADQDAINAQLAPLLSRKQRVVNRLTRRRPSEL
jgi:hypothetical protein